MPNKKKHFSAKRIKEIIQKLKAKLAEHMRKQSEGIPETVIETRHVMVVLDSKRGTTSTLMKEIRAEFGKRPTQKISVTEFCKFTSIPIDDVLQVLSFLT